MKLIAKTNFSQGPNNPLGTPDGSQHVEYGTPFSIGGDLPFEQLSKEQQTLHGALSHCSCPFDSDEGRKIFADKERAKISEEKMKQDKLKADPDNKWHKKPIGIVFLAVTGGLILLIMTILLKHILPQFFHD